MVRRLLTKPGLSSRLKDPRVVPLGSGKAVLGAIASLIAAWGNDGLYDEHVSKPALVPDGLEGRIVDKLRLTNSQEAVEQVRAVVSKLQAAELIDLTAEGVRLPLPALPTPAEVQTTAAPPAPGQPAAAVRSLPGRIGPARPGETEQHYKERTSALAAARRNVDRYFELTDAAVNQRFLVMSISGGKDEPNSSRSNSPGDIDRTIPEASREGTRLATAAALDDSTSSAAASRARDTREPVDMSRISNREEADYLASDLIDKFGWRREKTAGIVSEVQRWFAQGLTRQDVEPKIEELHERHLRDRQSGRPGVKSVAYVTQALTDVLASKSAVDRLASLPRRETASTTAAPGPAPTRDPRLVGCELSHAALGWAVRALDRLDRMAEAGGVPEECPSAGHEAFGKVSLARDQSRNAFTAIGRIYPQVYGWFGEAPAEADFGGGAFRGSRPSSSAAQPLAG